MGNLLVDLMLWNLMFIKNVAIKMTKTIFELLLWKLGRKGDTLV